MLGPARVTKPVPGPINIRKHGDLASGICAPLLAILGTAVAQWLRCCATDGVIGFFIDIKSFRSHYGPRVTASNRNEYQEHFLGVKAAGA